MKHKIIIHWIIILFVFFLSCEHLQAQTNPIPLGISIRKSIFGGSYVLQLKNTSANQLQIWLEAKEKVATYLIPQGTIKDVGWVQGFRFDVNDIFFIWADGYDTIKQAMPSDELSPLKIVISKEGGLAISFSQFFLQDQLVKSVRLPIKKDYPKVLGLEISDIPQIILKDGSDKVYTNAIIHVKLFSGKVKIPLNTTVSFVPFYNPSNGVISISQINVENINTDVLPRDWFEKVTEAINSVLPVLFATHDIYKLKGTEIKYFKFMNVRQIMVRDGRLEILIL